MAYSGYLDYLSSDPYSEQKKVLGFDRDLQSEIANEPIQASSPTSLDANASSPYLNALKVSQVAQGGGGAKGAGGAIQGALAGAAAGAPLGPTGAAAGAGLGVLAGIMSAKAQQEENRKAAIQSILKELGNDEQSALTGMGNMWARIL